MYINYLNGYMHQDMTLDHYPEFPESKSLREFVEHMIAGNNCTINAKGIHAALYDYDLLADTSQTHGSMTVQECLSIIDSVI